MSSVETVEKPTFCCHSCPASNSPVGHRRQPKVINLFSPLNKGRIKEEFYVF
jgi:hypothetical protein